MKKLGYQCWSKNKAKTDFEKDFFKSMDNAVFRKTIENVREGRRNNLVSEPKHHITNSFFWKTVSNKNEKNSDNYE